MSAPQNFRSAFNGFNREDVVHYLEYINTKHNNQVNQLTAEAEELRSQLEQQPVSDQQELVEQLQAQCEELAAQLEAAQARCAELEEQLSRKESPEEPVQTGSAGELEAYRRAERIERMARERAELTYHQANGVLAEATVRVESTAAEVTEMADHVMSQLTQLQVLVSGSKQALQDAASIMATIRPNK